MGNFVTRYGSAFTQPAPTARTPSVEAALDAVQQAEALLRSSPTPENQARFDRAQNAYKEAARAQAAARPLGLAASYGAAALARPAPQVSNLGLASSYGSGARPPPPRWVPSLAELDQRLAAQLAAEGLSRPVDTVEIVSARSAVDVLLRDLSRTGGTPETLLRAQQAEDNYVRAVMNAARNQARAPRAPQGLGLAASYSAAALARLPIADAALRPGIRHDGVRLAPGAPIPAFAPGLAPGLAPNAPFSPPFAPTFPIDLPPPGEAPGSPSPAASFNPSFGPSFTPPSPGAAPGAVDVPIGDAPLPPGMIRPPEPTPVEDAIVLAGAAVAAFFLLRKLASA